MRKAFAIATAAAAIAFAAPASAAVEITGGIDSVKANANNNPSYGLAITAIPLDIPTFTLANVGDSQDFSVLSIGTTEDNVLGLFDTLSYAITVTFSFLSPTGATGNPVTGTTSGFVGDFISPCSIIFGGCGQVTWGSPSVFSFGNGGQFSVALSDATFWTPGTANVTGRFTLLADSTPAVPEPATWAMLLIGFGAIGASLRSRNSRGQMRLRTA